MSLTLCPRCRGKGKVRVQPADATGLRVRFQRAAGEPVIEHPVLDGGDGQRTYLAYEDMRAGTLGAGTYRELLGCLAEEVDSAAGGWCELCDWRGIVICRWSGEERIEVIEVAA